MIYDVSNEKAIGMYKKMYLIRKYEESIYYLFLEGIMPGTIHQSHGQEACAVGMIYDLRKEDYVQSTHRPAGHCLAKGVSLKSMMCEMFGKANGCCKGKGGAMHTGDISIGMPPSIAIVGGGIPIAVGMGITCKMKKTDNVVVCFFGDGANNEGSYHESLNAAAIWDLPVIFVCENNQYGASTNYHLVNKLENLSDRAAAYGIPGISLDGNNVFEVNRVANEAINRARKGEGPTLIELKTYRIGGHSRNDACSYRNKDEEKYWFNNDPINNCRKYLLENNIISEEELSEIESEIETEIEDSIEFAKKSPDPDLETALTDIYCEVNM